MMDAKHLRLAARLLHLAADKFSNFGCNDFDLPDDWTDDECRELDRAIEAWNGTPEDHEPDGDHRMTMDWLLMRYLAGQLQDAAEKGVEG